MRCHHRGGHLCHADAASEQEGPVSHVEEPLGLHDTAVEQERKQQLVLLKERHAHVGVQAEGEVIVDHLRHHHITSP
eukprot:4722615-Pyramimonas_sp.AAC.1